jgi:hypothetical protein
MRFARVSCIVLATLVAWPTTGNAACFAFGWFQTCSESDDNTPAAEGDEDTSTQSQTVHGGTGTPGRSGSSGGTGIATGGSGGSGGDDDFDALCRFFGCD